jgi:hypothetical protein
LGRLVLTVACPCRCAGADAYLLADSLEELAAKIAGPVSRTEVNDAATTAAAELPTGTTVDELIAAFLRETVEYSTRVHADHPKHDPTK